ncbi:chemotaxis signal transduction protein CheV [Paraburkholderia sp. UYCP14C]|uniref:chemotaxis protein CheV n=1 Tax=Paraburkholderia sp. UYCP14C TaxID=2511130 RepID=UPI001021B76E|nr:chemotaxis protein [Paraburkholderia sp. UYCP14C]RZF23991.1 chemotaxis signal transduction protein CheV [Paraburkholderia sp. UYCP14C]
MADDHRANHERNTERSNLTSSNKFELLLYRLGRVPGSDAHELYGINVFKVREISTMPTVTPIAGSSPYVMGAVDIRGQIIPVIDLPRLMGCEPTRGLNILLVTEFARSTQAFAVEEVDDIVRLEWNQVLSADGSAGGKLVTSIARIDGNTGDSRLAQVIDVEQVLRDVFPSQHPSVDPASVGEALGIRRGAKILAADDSGFARKLIEQALAAIGADYIMTKTGEEAWQTLQQVAREAQQNGTRAKDSIALVLTDLEMPEMDGFMLTRQIKADERTRDIPVIIHSSLTGAANEAHVKNAGANGYVAKFAASELADAIRQALGAAPVKAAAA